VIQRLLSKPVYFVDGCGHQLPIKVAHSVAISDVRVPGGHRNIGGS
jgi:hypothetical protein